MNPHNSSILRKVAGSVSQESILQDFRELATLQRSFKWDDWYFGKDLIDYPGKICQLSHPNLLRLIYLIVKSEESERKTFQRALDTGAISEIQKTVTGFLDGTVHDYRLQVDGYFDFRADTAPNLDPDAHSETLRQYHKILWEKPLPNGSFLHLSNDVSNKYLYHSSENGDFNLTSDSISHSYHYVKRMEHIIDSLDPSWSRYIYDDLHRIGGYTLFEGGKRDGAMTINQARGCNQRIVDRFDLTLECIRRHYRGEISPLKNTFDVYSDFFDLFVSFEGFVEFFQLQDLVSDDCSRVQFLLPFDDSFPMRPFPSDIDEYDVFIRNTLEFVRNRTERIVGASTT